MPRKTETNSKRQNKTPLDRFAEVVDFMLHNMNQGEHWPKYRRTIVHNHNDVQLTAEINYDQDIAQPSVFVPIYADLTDDFANCLEESDSEIAENDIGSGLFLNYKYIRRFAAIAYHRISKFLVGIVSVLNFTWLIKPFGYQPALLSFTSGGSINLALAAGTLLYIGLPIIENHFTKKRQELFKIFVGLDAELFQHAYHDICPTLDKLSWQHWLILRDFFPNNRKLRWYYCYVVHHNMAHYNAAHFALARTRDEKISMLRAMLNDYGHSFRTRLRQIEFETGSNRELNYEKDYNSGKRGMRKYFDQLPQLTPKFMELGKKLHADLQTCIAHIKANDLGAAFELFKKIKLDGFNRMVFPNAAIVYHQLEFLFILECRPMKALHSEPFDEYRGIWKVERGLQYLQRDVDEHAMHKSEDFRSYSESFAEMFSIILDTISGHKAPLLFKRRTHRPIIEDVTAPTTEAMNPDLATNASMLNDQERLGEAEAMQELTAAKLRG